MILLIVLDLVITAGMALVGLMLGFVLVLAGLPEWLLWAIPTWFGCAMPLYRLAVGYPSFRRGRRPDHPQRPIAVQKRRREPRLEDIYP